MAHEIERLTTWSTTYWKYAFPTTWITVLGGFNVAMWLDLIGSPTPMPVKVAILGMWSVFSPFFIWYSRQMRHVWKDEDHLIVRPHGSDVRIPLSEIVEVRESRFRRVKEITIELRRDLPGVGRKIMFPAPFAWQKPGSDHPLVTRIRDMKRLQAGVSTMERIER
jgi:hypothetical protein